MKLARAVLVATSVSLFFSASPHAESAKDFFANKQMNLIISAGVGGGYDIYGRPLARHMAKHLGPNTEIIVQNMTGGGGIRAMNYIYNAAPRDGSILGLVQSSVPTAPLQGTQSAKFDSTKVTWIGSMNAEGSVCFTWHTAPISSFADLKKRVSVFGSSGAGSYMSIYPTMLDRLLGAKIKVVTGYKSGSEVLLAMGRGEMEGICGFQMTTIRSNHPDWIANHEVRFIVQTALHPESDPALANVPMALDMAKSDEDRAVMELLFANHQYDRPILAPPGVPADRAQYLRAAFKATLVDPAFLAEAKRAHLRIRYVSGEDVEALIKKLYAYSPSIIKHLRDTLQP